MIRRILYVLAFVIAMLMSVMAFAQADGSWQPLKGYWPGGQLTMDTEHFEYNKERDEASMWVKWQYQDGSIRRNHYLVHFPEAAMRVIYSGYFQQDETLIHEDRGWQKPFPVKPDSWQEEASNIIAEKVGRKPIYGAPNHWKWIGADYKTHDSIFIGEDTTTYVPDESACYVWILVKKAKGNNYTACYKCQFIAPYKLGHADATFYPEMKTAHDQFTQVIILGALAQYKQHMEQMK